MRKGLFSIIILFLTATISAQSETLISQRLTTLNVVNIEEFCSSHEHGRPIYDFINIDESCSGVIIEYNPQEIAPLTSDELLFKSTRFSTLKGLNYYSISKRSFRTLFKEIYLIKEWDSSLDYDEIKRIEDPAIETLMTENSYQWLFYQNDSSFKKSIWQVNALKTDQSILLLFENQTELKKIGITAVNSNDMKMAFLIRMNNETITISAIISTKIRPMPLLEQRIKKSLANRLNAVSVKLASMLTGVTLTPPIIER